MHQDLAIPAAPCRLRALVALAVVVLVSACSGAASPTTASPMSSAQAAASMVLPPRSIESNAPVAQRDDTRSPGSAAVPFATYLVAMHQRIHPIFTDQTAISRALTEPRAVDEDRVTVLEIVLSAAEGRLVRIGVVKASGVTAVDLIALGAVFHAQPFGKAPDSLVSPDGNVHMHWEFHSDPHDGCAPRNAYPYLLKSAP